jgi:hypothetical protein
MNNLKEGTVWHIDPLLGNDLKINEKMAVARQWPACNNGSTIGSGVFYVVPFKATSLDRLSSVQRVQCS